MKSFLKTVGSEVHVTVIGWLLLFVVGLSAAFSGLTVHNQSVQARRQAAFVNCQAKVNEDLLNVLNERDGYNAATGNNLDTLLHRLSDPANKKLSKEDQVKKGQEILTDYFEASSKVSAGRLTVKLPTDTDLSHCKDLR